MAVSDCGLRGSVTPARPGAAALGFGARASVWPGSCSSAGGSNDRAELWGDSPLKPLSGQEPAPRTQGCPSPSCVGGGVGAPGTVASRCSEWKQGSAPPECHLPGADARRHPWKRSRRRPPWEEMRAGGRGRRHGLPCVPRTPRKLSEPKDTSALATGPHGHLPESWEGHKGGRRVPGTHEKDLPKRLVPPPSALTVPRGDTEVCGSPWPHAVSACSERSVGAHWATEGTRSAPQVRDHPGEGRAENVGACGLRVGITGWKETPFSALGLPPFSGFAAVNVWMA